LNVHPAKSFWAKTFVLGSLRLVVLEKQHSDEEIQEEEAA